VVRSPIVERLCIVGAGDVVAKRIVPAILELGLAAEVLVLHDGICEIVGDAGGRVRVAEVRDRHALDALLRANRDPVLVATPPGPRMAIAASARAAGVPVILEKPLVATREALGAARRLGADPQVFALSYYVQEKALGWTWLCTRTPGLASWLNPDDGDHLVRAAAIADALGPLRALDIRIKEGVERSGHAHRSPWYAQVEHGVWLDMGVHVVSLAMLAALRETGTTALDIVPGRASDREDQIGIAGDAAGFAFAGRFGKNFADAEKERWLEARFDNGAFRCDFETGACVLTHRDGRRETLTVLHGDARYRTMMAQAGEFLRSGGWSDRRGDLVDLQCDALACIFDCIAG
jgi:predicted dehydrogenase